MSPVEGFGNCDEFRRSVKISRFLDSKVLMVKFESQVELITCVTMVTPISHCHPCSSFRDLVFPEVATQILSLHCSTAGRENTCISCIFHFSRSLHIHIRHITSYYYNDRCICIYICVHLYMYKHIQAHTFPTYAVLHPHISPSSFSSLLRDRLWLIAQILDTYLVQQNNSLSNLGTLESRQAHHTPWWSKNIAVTEVVPYIWMVMPSI